MIDVHILHVPGENQEWNQQCLDSVANEPDINVFNVNVTLETNMRTNRYEGFKLGTSDYVSFVDPDDYIYPGIFTKCLEELDNDSSLCGVYTLSNVMDVDGNITGLLHPYREYNIWRLQHNPLEIHQLVVMNKKLVLETIEQYWDYIPTYTFMEQFVYTMISLKGKWKALNHLGYSWRTHPTSLSHTNRELGRLHNNKSYSIMYEVYNGTHKPPNFISSSSNFNCSSGSFQLL